MAAKLYQALLVGAAFYILASDICSAVRDSAGAANIELERAAISQGMVVPE
jgi:hypothetical protein